MNLYRKNVLLAGTAALLLMACAVDTGSDSEPSSAVPEATSGVTVAPTSATPHCVAQLPSGATTCYPTFRDAIAAATNGKIADAPIDAASGMADVTLMHRIEHLADTPSTARESAESAAQVTVGDSKIEAIVPSATVVIGIEYVNASFQGATFTWTAGSGCDGNHSTVDFFASSMPSGWNDVISSFRSFSSCEQVLYENSNFGGSSTAKAVSLSSVGAAMNDRASSIRWF